MAKLSRIEMQNLVVEQVRANPGITHDALVSALESSGNLRAVDMIPRLSQANEIVAKVTARPDGPPVLTYTVPGTSQPAPPVG